MNITLLIKSLESGQVEASVLELPAYRVEAESRELAIANLQTVLLEKVQDAEAFDWAIPMKKSEPSPSWQKFAGVFKDNADFAEIVQEIQAAKDAWGDEAMDESEYMR
jgi:predicted RNase H-like HicB family nuclease